MLQLSVIQAQQPFVAWSPAFPVVPMSVETSPSTWRIQDQLRHADWGTAHPEFLKVKPRRVPWSTEEVNYIANWCENQIVDAPDRMASRCLAFILKDPMAIPIFHQHHILNSSRLRNGYNAYLRQKDGNTMFYEEFDI